MVERPQLVALRGDFTCINKYDWDLGQRPPKLFSALPGLFGQAGLRHPSAKVETALLEYHQVLDSVQLAWTRQ
jgi:hypothetical protein